MSTSGDDRDRKGKRAPSPHDGGNTVFLIGRGRQNSVAASLDTLSRLGLVQAAGGAAQRPVRLQFGATGLLLDDSDAARARFLEAHAAVPSISVGGADTALSDDAAVMALTLADDLHPSNRRQLMAAVQQLMAAAALIARPLKLDRLFWPPAGLWSPTAPLSDAITSLERLGLPPVLHIIGFVERGAERKVQSVGLFLFCGVEIALLHDGRLSGPELVRRLSRLVIHAMVTGPLQRGAAVAGLAEDERMSVIGISDTAPAIQSIRLTHG
jgi:hypothetical protein